MLKIKQKGGMEKIHWRYSLTPKESRGLDKTKILNKISSKFFLEFASKEMTMLSIK